MGVLFSVFKISYIMVVLPLLLGIWLQNGEKKNVAKIWTKGLILLYCLVIILISLARVFRVDFYTLCIWIKIMIGLLSVALIGYSGYAWIAERIRLTVNRDFLLHYIVSLGIVFFVTVFARDVSTDTILEKAYTIQTLNIIESSDSTLFALLSALTGMHVTLIGKLLTPFLLCIALITVLREYICLMSKDCKMRKAMLWIAELLILLLNFQQTIGFYDFWTAPWKNSVFVYLILIPFSVYLFLNPEWNFKNASCLIICIIGDILIHLFDVPIRIIPIGIVVGIGCVICVLCKCLHGLNKTWIRYGYGILCVICVGVSIVCKGCIFTELQYAFPDNKYKMDEQVMQIRILSQEVLQPRLISDLHVLSQIQDKDTFVDIPYPADILQFYETSEEENWKMAAETLELNHYEAYVMIQKANAFGCNLIAYPFRVGADDNPDNIFREYGFEVLGNAQDYIVYYRVE